MRRLAASAAAALLLGGCASFSSDGGFDRVAEMTRERTGQPARWQRTPSDADAARQRTAELLAQPLNADAAVELALINNRGLQASFAELGIAEAELIQVGRLANPTLGFTRLRGGGVAEIDRSVVFNVLGLLTLPLANRIEQQRFEQARFRAAFEAVGLAADTRRAYFAAIAAQDLVNYADQVRQAAEASNELARRMVQAGNFNTLAQMRQQAFYADATGQSARAQHRALAAREQLVRLLGLSAEPPLRLPDRLPDLPAAPTEPRDAEQTAIDQRLDVRIAIRSTDTTARLLGLTQATRFVNVLDVGAANKSQSGEPLQQGYQIVLELPIFDFGGARTARAEAVYLQSVHHAAEVATRARSEVRETYSAYRTAYDLARHYRDEVVPLRKRISDENLLRYNGMLLSVFELLADSREQVSSVAAYIESLRDFWIADTDLRTALTGRSPSATAWPPAGAADAGAATGARHRDTP